jgi:hypothetical protein
MKVGDLVQMKRRMFWDLKDNPYMHYTEEPLLVVEQAFTAVKLLFPNGRVVNCWPDGYEVISESR